MDQNDHLPVPGYIRKKAERRDPVSKNDRTNGDGYSCKLMVISCDRWETDEWELYLHTELEHRE